MGDGNWWSQPFVNDGGPLIVLPYDAAPFWAGTEADYALACDARRPFDVLPAGTAAVVAADSTSTMLHSAKWLRVHDVAGVTMVGWDTAEQDKEAWLVDRLKRPDLKSRRHRWRFDVPSGVLLVQHAAGPARSVRLGRPGRPICIGDTLPVGVQPGRYAVETTDINDAGRYVCVLCRWVPVGSKHGAVRHAAGSVTA